MTRRRTEVAAALAGLLVAAGLLYAAEPDSLSMWAGLALSGVAALLGTRTWGRIGVGALLVLCGFALAAGAWPRYAAGGLVLAATGLYVAVRGPRWPALGARYEAPAGARSEKDLWSAQDRGEDPTE